MDHDPQITFLRARIAEAEQRARACGPVPWVDTVPCAVHVDPAAIRDNKLAYGHLGYVAGTHRGELGDAYRAHIAHFSPKRMLDEINAKRQIIEHCVETIASLDPGEPADRASITDLTVPLRLLALPDADHPDYREEWRL
ncbi:hypothetical protein CU254_14770 [Amycolatopsis sp. AA4]|uniref:DUF6221 family protein n=1 Tax=Actinomycetes TaxID=1760 RepID=UPI0001B55014|nr:MULTISPECIES: DUF6221 family protein [Actinomycetes]ATY11581.1 hypothetical protein CU254_14770 [Amycolatopsis sp. AA4]EFL07224.1 hypothetical protein SSMG_02895 [Streptomyces sp. AA4]